jgi:hypothetical protein
LKNSWELSKTSSRSLQRFLGLFRNQKSKTVLDNSPKTDRILKFPQGEIFEIIGHRSHRFYWKPSRGGSLAKRGSSPMPFAEFERLEVAGRSAH